MASAGNDFLGIGWSFPPTFDAAAGTVVTVRDDEDIQQSLTVLFSTMQKERLMLPGYGCGLNQYVFDTVDSTLMARIRTVLSNAILYYEPRISVESITIVQSDAVAGLLNITLIYVIRQTNTRSNMVYPFYMQGEGTNVRRLP